MDLLTGLSVVAGLWAAVAGAYQLAVWLERWNRG